MEVQSCSFHTPVLEVVIESRKKLHCIVHCKLCISRATQSADSTVSPFVDSSAQHRGMRPNLIAMKNLKKILKPNLNQARTLSVCSHW